jgi:uncharacterized protein YdeI (YjbR/CyaY-like superfamily)
METFKDVGTVNAKTRLQWRKWLEKNGQSKTEIYLVFYHKNSTTKGIKYAEGVEEALCFGWIDSTSYKRDVESSYQRFSPRKPASNWSQSNRDRVARLEKEGRMTDAGRRVIEISKEKGKWIPAQKTK